MFKGGGDSDGVADGVAMVRGMDDGGDTEDVRCRGIVVGNNVRHLKLSRYREKV